MCKESKCEYKTNFIQALKDHNKEMHERNVCKECNTIVVGSAHNTNHEKTNHGKDRETAHSQSQTEAPVLKNREGYKKKYQQESKKITIRSK